jgi:hypothetical protein
MRNFLIAAICLGLIYAVAWPLVAVKRHLGYAQAPRDTSPQSSLEIE